jgi:lactoylglutathione lyase
MKIEHIGIWVSDLEGVRQFYEKYFGAASSEKYENPSRGFESYFLEFGTGARLEMMKRHDINQKADRGIECLGFAHLSLSVGSKEKVDEVTAKIRSDGFSVIDGPRRTGDGYYESIVLDPEGNRIEITV